MRINIRLFARLRELASAGEVALDVSPGLTLGGLTAVLRQRFPRLRDALGSVAVAVNGETAQPGVILRDGDEVAFLPPFSGG